MKNKRQCKSVTFNEKEKELLEYVGSKGEFSSFMKQLIRADMKNQEGMSNSTINELIEIVSALKFQMVDLMQSKLENNPKSNEEEKINSDIDKNLKTQNLSNFTSLDDL